MTRKKDEHFLAGLNAVGDCVFVGLSSGELFWELPSDFDLSNVKYFTRVSSSKVRSYLDIETREILWEFPSLPSHVSKTINRLNNMIRRDTEDEVGALYEAKVSKAQLTAIDDFLAVPNLSTNTQTSTDNAASIGIVPPSPARSMVSDIPLTPAAAEEKDALAVLRTALLRSPSTSWSLPGEFIDGDGPDSFHAVVIHSGELSRQTHGFVKSWKPRHVELTALYLAVYGRPNNPSSLKNVLPISRDAYISISTALADGGYEITFHTGVSNAPSESDVFRLETAELKNDWVRAFNATLDVCRSFLSEEMYYSASSNMSEERVSVRLLGKQLILLGNSASQGLPSIRLVVRLDSQTTMEMLPGFEHKFRLEDRFGSIVTLRFRADTPDVVQTFCIWKGALLEKIGIGNFINNMESPPMSSLSTPSEYSSTLNRRRTFSRHMSTVDDDGDDTEEDIMGINGRRSRFGSTDEPVETSLLIEVNRAADDLSLPPLSPASNALHVSRLRRKLKETGKAHVVGAMMRQSRESQASGKSFGGISMPLSDATDNYPPSGIASANFPLSKTGDGSAFKSDSPVEEVISSPKRDASSNEASNDAKKKPNALAVMKQRKLDKLSGNTSSCGTSISEPRSTTGRSRFQSRFDSWDLDESNTLPPETMKSEASKEIPPLPIEKHSLVIETPPLPIETPPLPIESPPVSIHKPSGSSDLSIVPPLPREYPSTQHTTDRSQLPLPNLPSSETTAHVTTPSGKSPSSRSRSASRRASIIASKRINTSDTSTTQQLKAKDDVKLKVAISDETEFSEVKDEYVLVRGYHFHHSYIDDAAEFSDKVPKKKIAVNQSLNREGEVSMPPSPLYFSEEDIDFSEADLLVASSSVDISASATPVQNPLERQVPDIRKTEPVANQIVENEFSYTPPTTESSVVESRDDLSSTDGTRKPLVRHCFDRFASQSGILTVSDLRSLNYDLCIVLSPSQAAEEIRKARMVRSSDLSIGLSYDEFSAWWRSSPVLSSFRSSDVEVHRRQRLSSAFRKADPTMTGVVTVDFFSAVVWPEMIANGLISSSRLQECLAASLRRNDSMVSLEQVSEFLGGKNGSSSIFTATRFIDKWRTRSRANSSTIDQSPDFSHQTVSSTARGSLTNSETNSATQLFVSLSDTVPASSPIDPVITSSQPIIPVATVSPSVHNLDSLIFQTVATTDKLSSSPIENIPSKLSKNENNQVQHGNPTFRRPLAGNNDNTSPKGIRPHVDYLSLSGHHPPKSAPPSYSTPQMSEIVSPVKYDHSGSPSLDNAQLPVDPLPPILASHDAWNRHQTSTPSTHNVTHRVSGVANRGRRGFIPGAWSMVDSSDSEDDSHSCVGFTRSLSRDVTPFRRESNRLSVTGVELFGASLPPLPNSDGSSSLLPTSDSWLPPPPPGSPPDDISDRRYSPKVAQPSPSPPRDGPWHHTVDGNSFFAPKSASDLLTAQVTAKDPTARVIVHPSNISSSPPAKFTRVATMSPNALLIDTDGVLEKLRSHQESIWNSLPVELRHLHLSDDEWQDAASQIIAPHSSNYEGDLSWDDDEEEVSFAALLRDRQALLEVVAHAAGEYDRILLRVADERLAANRRISEYAAAVASEVSERRDEARLYNASLVSAAQSFDVQFNAESTTVMEYAAALESREEWQREDCLAMAKMLSEKVSSVQYVQSSVANSLSTILQSQTDTRNAIDDLQNASHVFLQSPRVEDAVHEAAALFAEVNIILDSPPRSNMGVSSSFDNRPPPPSIQPSRTLVDVDKRLSHLLASPESHNEVPESIESVPNNCRPSIRPSSPDSTSSVIPPPPPSKTSGIPPSSLKIPPAPGPPPPKSVPAAVQPPPPPRSSGIANLADRPAPPPTKVPPPPVRVVPV